ncbi:MAG: dienelactone hydrolase family protein [Myxococcales bacterium]|nr:dienelactone hydrolase family protein [Myxococcales bacterium]
MRPSLGLALALLAACGGSDSPAADTGSTSVGATDAGTTSTDPTASSSGASTVADTSSSATTTPADSSSGDTGEPPMGVGPGPHAVGHTTTTLALVDGRSTSVQWWYPAAAAGDPTALADLEPSGPRQDALADAIAAAPEPCTRKQVASTTDAAPLVGEPAPVVVFSHCSDCLRYSSSTIAEQLASWGFVVAAPDHTDNTLFDVLDGTSVGVDPDFLATRGDDIVRVIDAIAADGADVPAALQGHLDVERLGVMGHSFGSVTAGWVAEHDDRVDAAVTIAAPVQNPLLPGVTVTNIDVPLLMLLAQEDNSILELGNNLIRSNFDDANPPVWLVEFVDAGHWSFSDVCALVEAFSPGCGDGIRQTVADEPFTYVDIDATRHRAADWATAFFAASILGDAAAQAWLETPPTDDAITVQSRL